MKWEALGAFLGGLFAALGEKLFGPKEPPPAPAPLPEQPAFRDIDAKVDAMLERLEAEERGRDSAKPVILPPPLPPRTPIASAPEDRAENGGALRGEDTFDPYEDEPPTVKPDPEDPPSTRREK